MSNNLDSNFKKMFSDHPHHEYSISLDSEYRYRIDAREKFLQSYKEHFQYDLQEKSSPDDAKHTDGLDKLVMKLLRQSLIF